MKFSVRRAIELVLLAIWFPNPQAKSEPFLRQFAGLALAPLSWPVLLFSQRARTRRIVTVEPGMPAVLIVGNLVAGGAGKTPATLAISASLNRAGFKVGLLCNAYRATSAVAQLVTVESLACDVGDEALLLARTSGLPVASGRQRGEALKLLCKAHPELQVIVSDDGLQHYGLARSLEFVVFDSRGAGNRRLLPAGPLREPLEHVRQMDAVLLNEAAQSPIEHACQFHFRIQARALIPLNEFKRLGNPSTSIEIRNQAGRSAADELRIAVNRLGQLGEGRLLGIAGIAQPQRFADSLSAIGLPCPVRSLGDHADLDGASLQTIDADGIVMTAKDAVKLLNVDDPRCWVLIVEAEFEKNFLPWLLGTIEPLIESPKHG